MAVQFNLSLNHAIRIKYSEAYSILKDSSYDLTRVDDRSTKSRNQFWYEELEFNFKARSSV